MRRAVCVILFAICGGLLLLSLVELALVWRDEATTFILPNATDVRIEESSPSRLQISYHLPPNQTEDALATRLVQAGWTRDIRGQLGRFRDANGAAAFMLFTRQNWLGLVPEVVTVGRATPDQHMVDIELSRCFTLGSWMRCF